MLNKKIVYENATKFVCVTCWGCAKQVTAPDRESLYLKLLELGWGIHNDSLRCKSCIDKIGGYK